MPQKPASQTLRADIDFHYDRHGQRLNFVCRQVGTGAMALEEFLERADIPVAILLDLAARKQQQNGQE